MRKLLITIGLITGAGSLYATPLVTAAAGANFEEIKKLIAGGADPNEVDALGRTPLQEAMRSGQIRISEYLINNGADLESKNTLGQTPLLIGSKAGWVSFVQFLINKGANINSRDKLGNTSLHLASQGDAKFDKDNVELLIYKNADVNSKNNQGRTPLHYAGSKEIADWLIYKGADVNLKDNEGNTPLHTTRNTDIADLLISKGADLNSINNLGQSVLWGGNTKVKSIYLIEHLISKGADANAKDNRGRSIVDYVEDEYIPNEIFELSETLRNKYGATSVEDELRKDLEALKQKVEQGSTGNTNPTDEWPRKMWEIDLGEEVIKVGGIYTGINKSIVAQFNNNIYWVSNDGNHFQITDPKPRQGNTWIYISNDRLVYVSEDWEAVCLIRKHNIIEKRIFKPNNFKMNDEYDNPHC